MKILFFVFGIFLLQADALAVDTSVAQLRPSLFGSIMGMTCPIEVVPGKSLGMIPIGATRDSLKVLKYVMKNVKGMPDAMIVGMYSVYFDKKGRVNAVEAELGNLPTCVEMNKKRIKNHEHTENLVKFFTGCGAETKMEGGNVIACKGIQIRTGGWGGQQKTPALRISAK